LFKDGVHEHVRPPPADTSNGFAVVLPVTFIAPPDAVAQAARVP
jgi:hypothetical protein